MGNIYVGREKEKASNFSLKKEDTDVPCSPKYSCWGGPWQCNNDLNSSWRQTVLLNIVILCLMSLETPINEDYFDIVSSVLLYINTLMVLYHLFMSSGSTGDLELYRNKLEVKFRCKTSRRQKSPNRRQKKLATNNRLSRGKANHLPNI